MTGKVVGIVPFARETPVGIEQGFEYVVRTSQGDLVRWRASKDKGVEPHDTVTFIGTVKGHMTRGDERMTDLHYCQVQIHVTEEEKRAIDAGASPLSYTPS